MCKTLEHDSRNDCWTERKQQVWEILWEVRCLMAERREGPLDNPPPPQSLRCLHVTPE